MQKHTPLHCAARQGDTRQDFLVSHDISWHLMTSHDISWHLMTSHDISWYVMISHDLLTCDLWCDCLLYHLAQIAQNFMWRVRSGCVACWSMPGQTWRHERFSFWTFWWSQNVHSDEWHKDVLWQRFAVTFFQGKGCKWSHTCHICSYWPSCLLWDHWLSMLSTWEDAASSSPHPLWLFVKVERGRFRRLKFRWEPGKRVKESRHVSHPLFSLSIPLPLIWPHASVSCLCLHQNAQSKPCRRILPLIYTVYTPSLSLHAVTCRHMPSQEFIPFDLL